MEYNDVYFAVDKRIWAVTLPLLHLLHCSASFCILLHSGPASSSTIIALIRWYVFCAGAKFVGY